ncbi:hypothetical protein M422DRAFT_261047 [Sphaerobolus stellatus SS14]|uniref:Unplaced genomic scaffold SPHSTscaffold_102, whole genome shotgun sequence n=1 Tax=Sphaerobolus stellatus (strain SS14) TaxID=990650 RepID=A0A0C9VGM7_SPHS4|nr:hypothetical protein M422DRAFT_261047 [Sphaerobolus stellatus SS14]
MSNYISVQADSGRSSSRSVSFARSERSIRSFSPLSACFLSQEPSPDTEINDLDPNPPILQAQKRKLDISKTGSAFGSDSEIQRPPKKIYRTAKSESEDPLPLSIKVTSSLHVIELEVITMIPIVWTVPCFQKAYLLDLSNSNINFTKSNGLEATLQAFIRAEDQDSWTGSGGKKAGDVRVFAFNETELPVLCRKAHLKCAGPKICALFDTKKLENYQRYEPDPTERAKFWNERLLDNAEEEAQADGPLQRFYMELLRRPCKVNCAGNPVIHKRCNSTNGQGHFIGCSLWNSAEGKLHRYSTIWPGINLQEHEELLSEHASEGPKVILVNVSEDKACSVFLPSSTHKKHCGFTHYIKGKAVDNTLHTFECLTQLLIFTPV